MRYIFTYSLLVQGLWIQL